MDDKLLLVAFHDGVSSDLFIHKLYDQEPQTMAELVHSTQSCMNTEDAIIAKKRKRAKRMEANLPRHSEQSPWPRRPGREIRKIKTTGRQVHLQKKASITRPWTFHLIKCLCRSKTIHPWSGQRTWKEIPTSIIRTSIVIFVEIIGMTRTNVMTWSSK